MIPYFIWEGFRIGPFYFYSWGLMAGIGILAAAWISDRKRKMIFKESLNENHFWFSVLVIVLSIFLGARISYIFETWSQFSNNLIGVIKVWEGGFSLFGGVIGGIISGILVSRFFKYSPLLLGYLLTPGWLVGVMFGRIGCFFIHDHPGKLTNFLFSIEINNVLFFEPALNEAVILAILAGIFIYLEKRFAGNLFFQKTEFLFSIAAYSFSRFWLDFARALPEKGGDDRYISLTVAQIMCVGAFVIAAWFIIRERRKV